MSTPQNETLKRTLGMREAVTITVGTVVGVGLFTTGAQIVGSMGSAVILATFMAMVISVYPSHLYAEMSAALPFAGGTYKYAQLGLGKAAGMLAGWNFIASLVAVTSGEAAMTAAVSASVDSWRRWSPWRKSTVWANTGVATFQPSAF